MQYQEHVNLEVFAFVLRLGKGTLAGHRQYKEHINLGFHLHPKVRKRINGSSKAVLTYQPWVSPSS
jgi:hypothetical protein